MVILPFTNEPDPLNELKILLSEKWPNFQEVKIPQILVANDADDPRIRACLSDGDVIVIKQDGLEKLTQRYNFTYYDRLFPVVIEMWTKESRQRMRNLGRMVRAIINDNIHKQQSYQLIRYKGIEEAVDDTLNIWRGKFRFQLESNAICIERTTTDSII
jgi:hypothetical protein